MTFEQLEYFLTTAKYLNLSKAAKELYISHSTISKSISSLEDELGTSLFIRKNNVMSLTPSGQYLRRQGIYMLQIWNTTKQQLHLIKNSLSGTVTFAIPDIFENKLFSALTKLGQQYPDVNLIFHSEDPLLIISMIRSGRADIGIVFSYQISEDEGDLGIKQLFKDSFRAFVNCEHPLATQSSVSLTDLEHECLIFPPKHMELNPDFELLQRFVDPKFSSVYQARNLDEIFFQIAINKGISILPQCTMRGRDFNIKALPIRDVEDTYYACVVWSKNNDNPLIPFITDQIVAKCNEEDSIDKTPN